LQFNTVIIQEVIIVHDLVYVRCWDGFYTLWSVFCRAYIYSRPINIYPWHCIQEIATGIIP